MVTWFTPEHGKIVTSVKGACRPKSAFLGQYDLFYTCDLLFYRHEHDGVHAIRECVPVALREPLRHHWRHAAAAAYLADLTARATVGHLDSAPIYDMLTLTLDRLASDASLNLRHLLLWYESHLLQQLGLMPDFTTCPACHPPDRIWLRFSVPSGRFVCPHLSQSQSGDATLTLHRGVRDLFVGLCQTACASFPEHAPETLASKKNSASANLLFGLTRFLGIFIAFHLDVPPAVRRVTFEMLDTNQTQTSA